MIVCENLPVVMTSAEPSTDGPSRSLQRLTVLIEDPEELERVNLAESPGIDSHHSPTRCLSRLPKLIAKTDKSLEDTMQMSPSTASRTKNLHGASGM